MAGRGRAGRCDDFFPVFRSRPGRLIVRHDESSLPVIFTVPRVGELRRRETFLLGCPKALLLVVVKRQGKVTIKKQVLEHVLQDLFELVRDDGLEPPTSSL